METQSGTAQASAALQRAALFGMVTSVAAVIGGVVRAKATAVALGPEGFGTFAAVQQIPGLLFVPLGLVTGPALISALARAKGDAALGQRYHDTAMTLVVAGGAALAALTVGAAVVVFRQQPGALIAFSALAAVGAVFDPLARIPNANLLARGEVRRYALIMAVTSVAVAVAAASATVVAGLWGQFVAAAVIPMGLLVAFAPVWRRALPDLRLFPRPTVDRSFVSEAVAVGIATLLSALASQGTLSVMRWSLWQHGGAEANGQFQAAWTVGSSYLGIVMQGIGTGVFPRYAAATRESLPAEVDAAARFVFDAAPPLILMAIAVREPVVVLLYSSKFDRAALMLGFQMAGDLTKALSFVYAGVLLYRGEVRAYLMTEAVGASLLALTTLALVPWFGELGASYGYVLSYFLYVGAAALVLSRACHVPVRFGPIAWSLVFTVAAVASVVLTDRWLWLRVPLFLGAGAWATRTGLARLVIDRVRARLAR